MTLLFGTMAFAQDDHKVEVTVGLWLRHANPQNNNIIPTFSLNGGGGSVAFYFSSTSASRVSLRVMAAILTTLLSLPRTATVLAPYQPKAICSPTTLVRS